jgi:DNA-directed RNA polymerase specialized sigma24 family protein
MSANTRPADSFAWLELRLDQWGAWKRGGLLIGLGYGSLLGRYTKHDTPRSTSIEHDNPAFDRMMLDVDRAIQSLPPEFNLVVKLMHDPANPDDVLPPAEMARVCRCSVATYYRRLRAAYVLLAEEVKP